MKVCIEYLSHQSNDIAFAALDIIHFVCKSGRKCMPCGNWDETGFGYYNRFLLVHDGQEEFGTMSWLLKHAQFLPKFIDCGIFDIILNIIKKGIRGNFSDAALCCLCSLLYSANKAQVFTFINAKFVRLVLNALVLFEDSWPSENGTSVVYSSRNSSAMRQLHNILMNKHHRIKTNIPEK
eukprot:197514_1